MSILSGTTTAASTSIGNSAARRRRRLSPKRACGGRSVDDNARLPARGRGRHRRRGRSAAAIRRGASAATGRASPAPALAGSMARDGVACSSDGAGTTSLASRIGGDASLENAGRAPPSTPQTTANVERWTAIDAAKATGRAALRMRVKASSMIFAGTLAQRVVARRPAAKMQRRTIVSAAALSSGLRRRSDILVRAARRRSLSRQETPRHPIPAHRDRILDSRPASCPEFHAKAARPA